MNDRAWPRASFIVCCFNQEQYIEEAVKAAFAQDYPNLEIVLSDDGSRDRTLEIARHLADEYRGPHELLVNERAGGEGVLAHVYDAAAKSGGELLVMAAGDDVSHPQRVRRLVEEWQRTGAAALTSRYRFIDEAGAQFPATPPTTTGYELGRYFPGKEVRQIAGATSAYDRRVFEAIKLPSEPVISEDYFFSLMLGLRSQDVACVEEPLVDYRRHSAALSGGGKLLRDEEAGAARTAGWTSQLLRLLERYADDPSLIDQEWGAPARIDRAALRADRAFFDYMSGWLSAPWPRRWTALARHGGGIRSKWLASRIFGLTGLERLRKLQGR